MSTKFTPEQIAIHLDEARFMLREPIKSFIALDDSARQAIAIIEQQRGEIEILRAENERLIEENAQRSVCDICRRGESE